MSMILILINIYFRTPTLDQLYYPLSSAFGCQDYDTSSALSPHFPSPLTGKCKIRTYRFSNYEMSKTALITGITGQMEVTSVNSCHDIGLLV